MDFLKKYPSMGMIRTGMQTPELQKTLYGGAGGIFQAPGAANAERKDMAKTALEGIGKEYEEATSGVAKATSDFESAISSARAELGTPASLLEKTYADFSKSFVPFEVWGKGGYEHTYMVPPKVIEGMIEELHGVGDYSIDLYDKDGSPQYYIDVHDRGLEIHEALIALPDKIKAGMFDKVNEAYQEGLTTINTSETEGMTKLGGYEADLYKSGSELGRAHANMKVGIGSALKGTAVDEGYKERRDERTQGFKVISRGSE